ncbi:hypothetical protein TCON_1603 [Astathelohania contejeani]|uniref:Uncharacterized protein n=1 Tax=Astathelohania contejeani TaxID=164912 RepID=A0ABQ7HYE1_9MICR|nr:hypothetical protein TCON_1603 [Thelohania contejeani]
MKIFLNAIDTTNTSKFSKEIDDVVNTLREISLTKEEPQAPQCNFQSDWIKYFSNSNNIILEYNEMDNGDFGVSDYFRRRLDKFLSGDKEIRNFAKCNKFKGILKINGNRIVINKSRENIIFGLKSHYSDNITETFKIDLSNLRYEGWKFIDVKLKRKDIKLLIEYKRFPEYLEPGIFIEFSIMNRNTPLRHLIREIWSYTKYAKESFFTLCLLFLKTQTNLFFSGHAKAKALAETIIFCSLANIDNTYDIIQRIIEFIETQWMELKETKKEYIYLYESCIITNPGYFKKHNFNIIEHIFDTNKSIKETYIGYIKARKLELINDLIKEENIKQIYYTKNIYSTLLIDALHQEQHLIAKSILKEHFKHISNIFIDNILSNDSPENYIAMDKLMEILHNKRLLIEEIKEKSMDVYKLIFKKLHGKFDTRNKIYLNKARVFFRWLGEDDIRYLVMEHNAILCILQKILISNNKKKGISLNSKNGTIMDSVNFINFILQKCNNLDREIVKVVKVCLWEITAKNVSNCDVLRCIGKSMEYQP